MEIVAFFFIAVCVGASTGKTVKEKKWRESYRVPPSPHLYVDKPHNLPGEESTSKPASFDVPRQHAPIDEEELVDVKTEKNENGTISISFTSHGKQHHLDLRESRTQLKDVDVRMLGASETLTQDVTEEIQKTKLMEDTRSRAMVAVELKDDGSILSIKRGVFQLGRHQFDIRSDIGQGRDKVRVKRRYVNNLTDRKRDYIVPEDLQRSKRDIPESIEPISATVELVMIIDYSIWNSTLSKVVSAENETDHMISLLLYYAHLADIMNVYYNTMKNDDISISVDLAGIVVLTTPWELSHLIQDHVVLEYYIASEETLNRLTQWLNTSESDEVLPPGDHVMLFTGYNMYDSTDSSPGIVGLAWTGSICYHAYSSSLVENIGLLTFDASTAAHELGHSLGSLHDGEDGSLKCEDRNYIMAAFAGNEDYLTNRFLFSCCSQRSFYATVHQSGSCLMNTTGSPNYPSSIDDKVSAYLPGQIFDADDQCYIAIGTEACKDPDLSAGSSICLSLWCEHPDNFSPCVTAYTAAADGTTCGDNKWCSLGACVDEGTSGTTLDQQCNVDECYEGESRCTNGVNVFRPEMLQCYLSEFTCDCYDDCTDGSDEVGCDIDCTCPEGFTRCTNGYTPYQLPDGVKQYCILDEWVCDGAADCSDNSDEINCWTSVVDTTTTPTTTTPTTTISYNGECYSCRRGGVCVTSFSLCEWICPKNSNCSRLWPTEPPVAAASVNQLNIAMFMFILSFSLY